MLGVILVNAILVGLETVPALVASYAHVFHRLDQAILAIFVVEICLRIAAQRPNALLFFRDGWNLFDFLIVAVSLLPQVGSFATVARMARLLRMTRLVSLSPELRLIVSTMLRSIPSLGHVALLLGLLLYIYGVLGCHLFRAADPSRWGTLGNSLLTLFQILTLEGWAEVQQTVLGPHPWAWVYFASFIVVAVFVVTNLFIAVVLNNLETAKAEHLAEQEARHPHADLLQRLASVRKELEEIERALTASGK